MIVKVQWPQFPPDGEIFVYSKPGPAQRHWMIPQHKLIPDVLARIREDTRATGKAYYDAHTYTTRKSPWPVIGRKVEDQPW